MSSKGKLIIYGSAMRVLEFLANVLVGLFLMPFLIHSLGDKMYGLWIFVGSFLGYYGLMDFGLSSAIRRFVSKAIGEDDHDEIIRVVNTALVIFSVTGVAAFVVSLGIALLIPTLISHIDKVATFRKLILILGVNCAFGFPLRVFSGVLSAHLRYDVDAYVEILKLGARTALIVYFLKSGAGIIALAMITTVMDLSAYGVKYITLRRLYPWLYFSPRLFERVKVRKLFGYSVYTFISQIADQLRFNIDNLVIVTFVGLSPVTLYSIGARLIKYFIDLVGSALGFTMPMFSQYDGAGDYDAIREKFIFMTKVGGYLSFLIGGGLIIFGKAFIVRWVGLSYADAYAVMVILLIPSILETLQAPGWGVLFGLSRHKYFVYMNISEGIANLVISVILVKKYGIYGVAWGTAIPMILMKLFVQPIYTCKVIGLSLKRYYFKLMLPIVAISGMLLFTCWLFLWRHIVADYLTISFLVSIVIFFYTATVYLVGFDRNEKKYLLNGVGIRT